MELVLLTIVFLLALCFSWEIAIAMLLATTALIMITGAIPFDLVVQKMVQQVSLFTLVAIPAFIFAGELMSATGLTSALSNFALLLVGRWRTGIGLATVLACMFFGGLTGSGLADTVAIATLMIPIMIRNGYPPRFAAAVVASGGSLGPIIPPSIPMVIYASIVPTVSVAALFVGGIVPGVMIAISFLIVVMLVGSRILGPVAAQGPQLAGHSLRIIGRFLPAAVIPVIILYGVVGGVVTVTESATLAVVYALGYGLVTRTLTLQGFRTALHHTVLFTGLVGFIIAAAGPFSFFLALYRAPEAVGHLLLTLSGGNHEAIMLILIVVLFILGCLVEATSLVIILAPILAGTAAAAGINQLHMALVAIVALMIGLFTPPVGTNLFAVVGIAKESLESISRALIPFIISAMVVVVIMALSPRLVTFLPTLLLHRAIP